MKVVAALRAVWGPRHKYLEALSEKKKKKKAAAAAADSST